MGYVPKGAPKGKKSKELFYQAEIDVLTANDLLAPNCEVTGGATDTRVVCEEDMVIQLAGHASTDLFVVEDDASHTRFSVAGDGAITLPADSIDNAMLAVVTRDITVANLAATGTVTNAADINGVILGVYPISGAEQAVKSVALTAVSGKIDVELAAAQAAGDAHIAVVVLQA